MPGFPTADPVLVATRRALHAVSELVLAGPQYARSGSIELRVLPDGFGTHLAPDLRVTEGGVLVDGRTEPVDGRTPRSLATACGVEARGLEDVYADGSGVGVDDPLVADGDAVRRLLAAFVTGRAALVALAPAQEPVLWPEHFDVGITVGEVNYGVSPGDALIPVPYAYVGPWSPPAADDFWDQPFGAARDLDSFADAAAVQAFFEESRARLRG